MKPAAIPIALCLCGSLAAAEPEQKIYAGEEAAALRCANTIALTAVALAQEANLPEQEKDVMLGIAVLILERHVSGTWQQKRAALEVVRDRRGAVETLQDYERLSQKCLRQFPIN